MTEWWTMHDGAMIGAIGGSAIGVFGAMIGAMAGVLTAKGRGRGLVVGSMMVVACLGTVALIAGIVAVSTGQPYHVWYPLMLGGGITSLVVGSLIPVMLQRYRQAEARRMDAQGLRRS